MTKYEVPLNGYVLQYAIGQVFMMGCGNDSRQNEPFGEWFDLPPGISTSLSWRSPIERRGEDGKIGLPEKQPSTTWVAST
jgi:hypothetical protein